MRIDAIRPTALALATAAVLTGCGFHAPPVRVQGTPAMLEQLSGEWWGAYVGDRMHGRNGSIVFKLEAGALAARGDVLMTPRGADRPYRPRDDRDQPGNDLPVGASNVLTIRFVTAIDGTITGVLDRYWDPDRRTEATARFEGRFTGDDTIEGTFTTVYADGQPSTGGRWEVTRRAPSEGGVQA